MTVALKTFGVFSTAEYTLMLSKGSSMCVYIAAFTATRMAGVKSSHIKEYHI